MKRHHALIIDTETAGNLDKPTIYDIGAIVVEFDGKRYQAINELSVVIKQTYDNKPLFQTAYYGEKRADYTNAMKGRKTRKRYYGHTMQSIKRLIEKHNIKTVYAYNANFDKRAIANTTALFNTQDIFKGITWRCIYGVANSYIHATTDYLKWCKRNYNFTKKLNAKADVQTTYQYLTQDQTFRESHTGLKDCQIELEILNECLKRGYKLEFCSVRYHSVEGV